MDNQQEGDSKKESSSSDSSSACVEAISDELQLLQVKQEDDLEQESYRNDSEQESYACVKAISDKMSNLEVRQTPAQSTSSVVPQAASATAATIGDVANIENDVFILIPEECKLYKQEHGNVEMVLLKEVKFVRSVDFIVSDEVNNCIYVSNIEKRCIWKFCLSTRMLWKWYTIKDRCESFIISVNESIIRLVVVKGDHSYSVIILNADGHVVRNTEIDCASAEGERRTKCFNPPSTQTALLPSYRPSTIELLSSRGQAGEAQSKTNDAEKLYARRATYWTLKNAQNISAILNETKAVLHAVDCCLRNIAQCLTPIDEFTNIPDTGAAKANVILRGSFCTVVSGLLRAAIKACWAARKVAVNTDTAVEAKGKYERESNANKKKLCSDVWSAVRVVRSNAAIVRDMTAAVEGKDKELNGVYSELRKLPDTSDEMKTLMNRLHPRLMDVAKAATTVQTNTQKALSEADNQQLYGSKDTVKLCVLNADKAGRKKFNVDFPGQEEPTQMTYAEYLKHIVTKKLTVNEPWAEDMPSFIIVSEINKIWADNFHNELKKTHDYDMSCTKLYEYNDCLAFYWQKTTWRADTRLTTDYKTEVVVHTTKGGRHAAVVLTHIESSVRILCVLVHLWEKDNTKQGSGLKEKEYNNINELVHKIIGNQDNTIDGIFIAGDYNMEPSEVKTKFNMNLGKSDNVNTTGFSNIDNAITAGSLQILKYHLAVQDASNGISHHPLFFKVNVRKLIDDGEANV